MRNAVLSLLALVVVLPLQGCSIDVDASFLFCVAGDGRACTQTASLVNTANDFDLDGVLNDFDTCPTVPARTSNGCPAGAPGPSRPGADRDRPGRPTGFTGRRVYPAGSDTPDVVLNWDDNPESDVASYRVRRLSPREISPREEVVRNSAFTDRQPPVNAQTLYDVVAVDAAGNQSERAQIYVFVCRTGECSPNERRSARPRAGTAATVTVRYAGKVTRRGRGSASGGKLRMTGGRAAGTYRLTGSVPRGFARGRWRARYDLGLTVGTGKATTSGTLVLFASTRAAGRLCARFTAQQGAVKGGARSIASTVTVLGGSGRAARLAGTATARRTGKLGLRLTLRQRLGKPRALTPACRALVARP